MSAPESCTKQGQLGFSLIEVLIALVIVAVGLLGLAGLNVKAQQAELESYQRSQALVLLNDMASRIQANRKSRSCYDLTSNGIDFVGTGFDWVNRNCDIPSDLDLADWDQLLDGAAEQATAGTNVGAMIGARGCIAVNGDDYIVSVAWQGLSPTVAPTNTCGQGQFTDDAMRRVVSLNIRLVDPPSI